MPEHFLRQHSRSHRCSGAFGWVVHWVGALFRIDTFEKLRAEIETAPGLDGLHQRVWSPAVDACSPVTLLLSKPPEQIGGQRVPRR